MNAFRDIQDIYGRPAEKSTLVSCLISWNSCYDCGNNSLDYQQNNKILIWLHCSTQKLTATSYDWRANVIIISDE